MNNAETLLELNQLTLDLVAADFSDGHSPTQGGPTKTSRALAIIHLAIHDAYGILSGTFAPRLKSPPALPFGLTASEATLTAAMGSACFAACRALYPDEARRIQEAAEGFFLRLAPGNPSSTEAEIWGASVAAAWLVERAGDGSATTGRYQPGDQPGVHRVDPLHPDQGYLHPAWGHVRPFVLNNVRTDAPLCAPPALDSLAYATAFDQVAVLGAHDLPERDAVAREQAVTGIFWGYDGTNRLGTPPRLYNQVVREIVRDRATAGTPMSLANAIRLFTGVNAAMADAGIAAWYWKYVYNFWRPVVGIREADPGWGPAKIGDGNTHRREKGNPFWTPLGAPATNVDTSKGFLPKTENFSPSFPAYPSGHATFGTACFEFAAAFLGMTPEQVSVRFTSDEWNGVNKDNRGRIRPALSRTFTLREAIEQNKISRVYLGVHWEFDATGGDIVGQAVAKKTSALFTRIP
jgi:membrane-associated phospholipid phosphatase